MLKLEKVCQKIEAPKDFKKVDLTYYLVKPFVKAHVYFNGVEIMYEVIEPKLAKNDIEIFNKIYKGILQLIDISPTKIPSHNKLVKYLEDKIRYLLEQYDIEITDNQFYKIVYFIHRDFVGLNEIEPLMHDDYIEDINCNGLNTEIYIKHRLFGNVKTNIKYSEEFKLKDFIIKLAQRCNRYITYSSPFLEGSLEDGSRVQGAISEEVSPRGPNFSIRKFRRIPFSPTELIVENSISAESLAYLWYMIEHQVNILIIGSAGAGKTTFLNAISLFIPINSKIVSIEDTRELRFYHENWIATVSRESFGGLKIGEVDLNKLLRESFRENPDYVVVGEVRGKETYVMFQGIASGHPTLSTFHSDDLTSVVSRLKTPPISLSSSLIDLLDIVITVAKYSKKNLLTRKVKKIEEFMSTDESTGKINTNNISVWNGSKDNFNYNKDSKLAGRIASNEGIDAVKIGREIEKRTKFLKKLVSQKIFNFDKVQKELQKYDSSI